MTHNSTARDAALIGIRPQLDLPVSPDMSEMETFQNQTLRPLLKFQNDLLLALLAGQLEKRKIKIDRSSGKTIFSDLDKIIKRDTSFKNGLIYMVVGLMSLEEVAFFQKNKSECSKRIINMVIQRLTSQYPTL